MRHSSFVAASDIGRSADLRIVPVIIGVSVNDAPGSLVRQQPLQRSRLLTNGVLGMEPLQRRVTVAILNHAPHYLLVLVRGIGRAISRHR